MTVRVVYATTTTSVHGPSGMPVQIVWGSHWPASDPVVLAHPELFTDDPTPGLRISAPLRDPVVVEQATAAPGERRIIAPQTQADAAFDEAATLRVALQERGVRVDGRWSLQRLRDEHAKVDS